MVGVKREKFLDALAVDAQLFFDHKEETDQRKCPLAFGIGRRFTAAKLCGPPEELHPARTALGAPQMVSVQEFFPLSFAGFFQSLGRREALDKHPRTGRSPVLKSFQRCGVILGQSMAQLVNIRPH